MTHSCSPASAACLAMAAARFSSSALMAADMAWRSALLVLVLVAGVEDAGVDGAETFWRLGSGVEMFVGLKGCEGVDVVVVFVLGVREEAAAATAARCMNWDAVRLVLGVLAISKDVCMEIIPSWSAAARTLFWGILRSTWWWILVYGRFNGKEFQNYEWKGYAFFRSMRPFLASKNFAAICVWCSSCRYTPASGCRSYLSFFRGWLARPRNASRLAADCFNHINFHHRQ